VIQATASLTPSNSAPERAIIADGEVSSPVADASGIIPFWAVRVTGGALQTALAIAMLASPLSEFLSRYLHGFFRGSVGLVFRDLPSDYLQGLPQMCQRQLAKFVKRLLPDVACPRTLFEVSPCEPWNEGDSCFPLRNVRLNHESSNFRIFRFLCYCCKLGLEGGHFTRD
jgi:hypothetical protein